MSVKPGEIKRSCSLPSPTADGKRKVEDCGHPSFRLLPRTDYCVGCIVSSMRGGYAIDVAPPTNTQTEIKVRHQS